MKILYISQYYPPEMGAPSARVSELAKHWVNMGHDVTVLTGFPNHPTGVLHEDYRSRWRRLVAQENDNGVQLVRTWLWPRPNRGYLDRLINYGTFMLSAALSGMFIKAPEVVIATSPQLLVGLAGWWVSRIHGAHFIFEVRDLWPESLVAVGASGQKSLMVNVLRAIASFLYRYADKIVVVSPAFCEYLIQHWKVPVEKIEIVENGVEAELFSKSVDIAKVRERFHLGSGIVVSYIGTLGMAHGLETLLGAAAQLSKTHSSITFLLLGEGAAKKDISDRIVQLGLTNMKLHSAVLREEVPDVIAASDICLVLLRRSEVFKTVIPTKMLEFMAGGKAVILGAEGQAQQILEEAKGGLCITPEDTNGLSSAISRLAEDKELRQRLGNNGRKYVEENLSRKKSAVEYIAVMEMFNHTE